MFVMEPEELIFKCTKVRRDIEKYMRDRKEIRIARYMTMRNFPCIWRTNTREEAMSLVEENYAMSDSFTMHNLNEVKDLQAHANAAALANSKVWVDQKYDWIILEPVVITEKE